MNCSSACFIGVDLDLILRLAQYGIMNLNINTPQLVEFFSEVAARVELSSL
jgi:hypothetical protein